MTIHSNVSKKLPQNIREQCLQEVFNDEIKPFAKKLGIKLALENLSYTSTGFGKNVEGLEEVLDVIDDTSMGITFDLCHALETKETDNLLDKYGEPSMQCSHGGQSPQTLHQGKTRINPFPNTTTRLRI